MIIPSEQLAPETLEAIIKEFIFREGTDYGTEEVSVDQKIEQVKQQLADGTAVVVYSELHQSVNILPAEQFRSSAQEIDA